MMRPGPSPTDPDPRIRDSAQQETIASSPIRTQDEPALHHGRGDHKGSPRTPIAGALARTQRMIAELLSDPTTVVVPGEWR